MSLLVLLVKVHYLLAVIVLVLMVVMVVVMVVAMRVHVDWPIATILEGLRKRIEFDF